MDEAVIWKGPSKEELEQGASLMQLSSGELQALVKHNEDEIWIWDQMINFQPGHERNPSRAKVRDYHRSRCRQLKELEALESQRQEKYEKEIR